VLLAVIAGLYAAYHGPDGLRRIARRLHAHTRALAALLSDAGCRPAPGPWPWRWTTPTHWPRQPAAPACWCTR